MTTETDFNIVQVDSGGEPIVAIYGDLDVVSSATLHAALTKIIEQNPKTLLVDLANVTFIDSTALGTLLVAHRHLHDQGGELRLVAVPAPVARVFEIAGLSDRFHIFADLDTARHSRP